MEALIATLSFVGMVLLWAVLPVRSTSERPVESGSLDPAG